VEALALSIEDYEGLAATPAASRLTDFRELAADQDVSRDPTLRSLRINHAVPQHDNAAKRIDIPARQYPTFGMAGPFSKCATIG
jgi:hypothetical protein